MQVRRVDDCHVHQIMQGGDLRMGIIAFRIREPAVRPAKAGLAVFPARNHPDRHAMAQTLNGGRRKDAARIRMPEVFPPRLAPSWAMAQGTVGSRRIMPSRE